MEETQTFPHVGLTQCSLGLQSGPTRQRPDKVKFVSDNVILFHPNSEALLAIWRQEQNRQRNNINTDLQSTVTDSAFYTHSHRLRPVTYAQFMDELVSAALGTRPQVPWLQRTYSLAPSITLIFVKCVQNSI